MVLYSLNIEEGGGIWYVHVAELPGCFTRGHSRNDVLLQIPEIIHYHLNWLANKGQLPHSPQSKTITFTIAEEIHDISQLGMSGGTVALFKTDHAPVTQQTLDDYLTLMSWTRQDLFDLVTPLPAATRKQRNIPNKRSIDRDLQHIANAEQWYISRLGPDADSIFQQAAGIHEAQLDALPTLRRLTAVREAAVKTLKTLYPTVKRGVFTRPEYTNHPDEPWTFQKVLRRFIEHEKEHIGTIQRSLAYFKTNY